MFEFFFCIGDTPSQASAPPASTPAPSPELTDFNQTAQPSQVIVDICADFTFTRRRQLQNGGEDCSPNMLATARENPNLSTVVELFELAGFEDVFACGGPFTGFLPTNNAFAALDQQILDFLLDPANLDALQGLLLYHLLPEANTVADLNGKIGEVATLLSGESLVLTTLTNSTNAVNFQVNDAFVVDPDVNACNGIIHVIDDVLLPVPGKFSIVIV